MTEVSAVSVQEVAVWWCWPRFRLGLAVMRVGVLCLVLLCCLGILLVVRHGVLFPCWGGGMGVWFWFRIGMGRYGGGSRFRHGGVVWGIAWCVCVLLCLVAWRLLAGSVWDCAVMLRGVVSVSEGGVLGAVFFVFVCLWCFSAWCSVAMAGHGGRARAALSGRVAVSGLCVFWFLCVWLDFVFASMRRRGHGCATLWRGGVIRSGCVSVSGYAVGSGVVGVRGVWGLCVLCLGCHGVLSFRGIMAFCP